MRNRQFAVVMLAVALAVQLFLVGIPANARPPGSPSGSSGSASRAAKPKTGKLILSISAPRGIPATVRVTRGKTRVYLTKALAGTSAARSVALTAGTYTITALPTVYAGRVYLPTKPAVRVKVKEGKTARKSIAYRLVDTARDLKVTKAQATSVQLRWTGSRSSAVRLRMVAGTTPVNQPSGGTAVSFRGVSVLKQGLKPGQAYSFSLFTQVGKRWFGPVTRTVTTAPAAGSASVAYAAAASTIIAKPGQVAAVPARSGVVATVPGGMTPVIGQVLVLPVSAKLPGGFIGRVTAVSSDGRTVALAQAGISDAFDAYIVNVTSFTGKPIALTPDRSAAGQARLRAAARQQQPTARSENRGRAGSRAATSAKDCLSGSISAKLLKINMPTIQPSGSFSYSIDKLNVFGVSVTTGAQVATEVKFKLTQTMDIDVESSLSCGIPFKPITYPFAAGPVPMLIYFQPTFQTSITGVVNLKGLGATVTNGVWAKAKIGVTNGLSVTGGPIYQISPLLPTPTVSQLKVESTLSGEFALGPGIGSPAGGVVAGLNGKINLLDVSLGNAFPEGDPRYTKCFQAAFQFSAEAGLSAKVWVGNWDASVKATVPIGGPVDLLPKAFLPKGCDALPDVGKDVIGPGVTKTSDEVTGNPEQWGKTDVFTTGTPAWILSTGRMASISGSAADFASTNLGLAGDARLTELAGGLPTYDAAAYTANVVPQGNTLHVRYIFASEEYPEYVGSEYDDVMAVYVNGVNCATVADGPVSVNTVNAVQNSDLYIENDGTKPTSMDGYTVPLQCNVAVTPGVPVTVQVAVADTSDHAYDSAVGLLEKGIWSD